MKILKPHAQFIHTEIEWNSYKWLWSIVYGDNHCANRIYLWNGLRELASSINVPWLVQGDFNAILHINDKMGVRILHLILLLIFSSVFLFVVW